MILRDKAGIKGRIIGRVISLDPIGMEKLRNLQSEYGDPKPGFVLPVLTKLMDEGEESKRIRASRLEYRRNPEYLEKRAVIYAGHGSRKKRTTWNIKVFLAAISCFFHKEWRDGLDMFKFEMGITHNIVTDEGDALVADIMSQTPTQQKLDTANGHVEVGTGWTGTTPKQNTSCNTSVAVEVMDATYPKLKGTWGNTDDNVTQYRATFEAGEAEATDLDEAALLNNIVPASGDCLAYGQITPAVTVGSSDTLQVDWELTYLGA